MHKRTCAHISMSFTGPRLVDPKAKKDEIVGLFRYSEEKTKVSEVLKYRSQAIISNNRMSTGSTLPSMSTSGNNNLNRAASLNTSSNRMSTGGGGRSGFNPLASGRGRGAGRSPMRGTPMSSPMRIAPSPASSSTTPIRQQDKIQEEENIVKTQIEEEKGAGVGNASAMSPIRRESKVEIEEVKSDINDVIAYGTNDAQMGDNRSVNRHTNSGNYDMSKSNVNRSDDESKDEGRNESIDDREVVTHNRGNRSESCARGAGTRRREAHRLPDAREVDSHRAQRQLHGRS